MQAASQVRYDARKGAWEIEVPSHVSIKMKRWFGKIDRGAARRFTLSHNTETACDLEMFIARFGLSISDADRAWLVKHARAERERTAYVQDLITQRKNPDLEFELAVPARSYQKIAGALALRTGGLLLGDPLGSGKTVSAICAALHRLPALVVTKVHLLRQWQEEFKKFAPHVRTHIVTKGTPYDYNAHLKPAKGQVNMLETQGLGDSAVDVLIINYHKLAGWIDALVTQGFKIVVLDECQEARRTTSEKYHALKTITAKTPVRIGLSATPIFNYGGEFFNIIQCLLPGALGTKPEFLSEWCQSSAITDKELIKNPEEFGSWIRAQGLFLRRSLEELGLEVPKVTYVPHEIEADLDSLKRVSLSCADLARSIVDMSKPAQERGFAAAQFDIKLRQATGIAKAYFIASFVRLLLESGEEKILLAAWHREVYAILLDQLKEFEPVMFTGSETPAEKHAAKQKFLGKSRVLIMSLRSGEGLDGLQDVCRTIVIGELDWSPAVHDQIIGRLNRPGQKAPVIAYFLHANHGSDPFIVDMLGLKRLQSDGVIDLKANGVIKQIDPEHIKNLAVKYLAEQNKMREVK